MSSNVDRSSEAPARVDLWVARATIDLARASQHFLTTDDVAVVDALRTVERRRRIVQLAMRRSIIESGLTPASQQGPTGQMTPKFSASHFDDVAVLAAAFRVEALP